MLCTKNKMESDAFQGGTNNSIANTNNLKNPFSKKPNMINNENREIARKTRYEPSDKGPFCVFIEKTGGENINKIKVGSFIISLNIKNIVSITSTNRKKIKVQTFDFSTANKMLNEKKFSDNGYDIFLPPEFITSIGVIHNIDSDTSVSCIQSKIRCIGQHASTKIEKVSRMQRWNNESKSSEPCNKIIVQFRSQKLPDEVEILWALHKVKLYTKRPMQCKNCYKYGHPASRCRGEKICSKCTIPGHEINICTNPMNCIYCKVDTHKSTDRLCPEYLKQQSITNIMTEKRLSYSEAIKQLKQSGNFNPDFPPLGNQNNRSVVQYENITSYASITQFDELKNQIKELNDTVKQLANQLAMRDLEIQQLKKENLSLKETQKISEITDTECTKIQSTNNNQQQKTQNQIKITTTTNRQQSTISHRPAPTNQQSTQNQIIATKQQITSKKTPQQQNITTKSNKPTIKNKNNQRDDSDTIIQKSKQQRTDNQSTMEIDDDFNSDTSIAAAEFESRISQINNTLQQPTNTSIYSSTK